MLVFRQFFLCHLNSFTLFLSSSSSSLLLFSRVFPAFSQWLHLSMSLCVFLCLVSARLHEHYAGVRGPALPGLSGAADQLFITAKQILPLSRALAGGLKKTERERERLKRESFSISLSPSHTFSLKWSHYHLYVLAKRVLAFAVFNHRFCILSFFLIHIICPFYSLNLKHN